jgi:amidase
MLGPSGFMTLPSAPGPAPLKGLQGAELEDFRVKALSLTSIAGLCGLPQVSIPCAKVDGLPVGLSIIAPRGWDRELLRLTVELASVLMPNSAC